MPLFLRTTLEFQGFLANGREHEYASERRESLRVYLSHGLSGAERPTVVVSSDVLASAQQSKQLITVDVPFHPRQAAAVRAAETRHWTMVNDQDAPVADAAPKRRRLPGVRGNGDDVQRETDIDDGRALVPPSASLGITGYVHTATRAGVETCVRAGDTLFSLADLAALQDTNAHLADTGQMRAGEVLAHAMWQTTAARPLIKGFVGVHAVSVVDGRTHRAPTTGVQLGAHIRPDRRLVSTSVFGLDDGDEGVREHAKRSRGALARDATRSLSLFYPPSAFDADLQTPESDDDSDAELDPPLLERARISYVSMLHCPRYETGTAGLVSGSAFVVRAPRTVHADSYFVEALRMSLHRSRVSAAELVDGLQRFDVSGATEPTPAVRLAARVMVEMLTARANSYTYVDDFSNEGGDTLVESANSPTATVPSSLPVERASLTLGSGESSVKIIESYKDAGAEQGGDCEDLAKTVKTDAVQMARAVFNATARIADTAAFLRAAADFGADAHVHDAVDASVRQALGLMQHTFMHSHALMFMLPLGGVASRKLEHGARFTSEADANAHTWMMAVPTARLRQRLYKRAPATRHVLRSKFFRRYAEQPWHSAMDVLIGEGTARASPHVLPLSTYYPSARAARRQRARAKLQATVAARLPMDVVGTEVFGAPLDDQDGRIAADGANVSGFYNTVSTAYFHETHDVGVLDGAWAEVNDDDDEATHGVTFTAVALRQWPRKLRFVPFHRRSRRRMAQQTDVLEKLEPIPAVRRDATAAARVEALRVPAALRAFQQSSAAAAAAAAADDAHDADTALAGLPDTVVFTVHGSHLTDEVAAHIARGLRETRAAYAGAPRLRSYYLADAPVSDDSGLPPSVQHDIELRVHDDDDANAPTA